MKQDKSNPTTDAPALAQSGGAAAAGPAGLQNVAPEPAAAPRPQNGVVDQAEFQTLRREFYAERDREWNRRELSNAEQIDKAILTFSSAGLGLSLGFLKDFVPITAATQGWLLYGSWILFTLAIASTIVSLFASQRAIVRQRDIDSQYYLQGDESATELNNGWAGATNWLNTASGVVFLFAVIFTTAFVSLNLERVGTMTNKIVSDGAPVARVQKIERAGDVQRGAPVTGLQKIPQAPTNGPSTGHSNSNGSGSGQPTNPPKQSGT